MLLRSVQYSMIWFVGCDGCGFFRVFPQIGRACVCVCVREGVYLREYFCLNYDNVTCIMLAKPASTIN